MTKNLKDAILYVEILSNSAGELKDTRKEQREGDMLDVSLFVSQVLQALTVALTIGVVAIWAVVLKETISLFLESFGLKKTVVVATMALMLLSVATTNAGEVARLEGNSLVYYQTTKEIPNVPSGITAEQAQQLVEGVMPSVTLHTRKSGYTFGLPLTKIETGTTVLFRNGWVTTEGESHESLSAGYLFINVVILLYGLVTAYMRSNLDRIFLFVLVFILIGEVTWLPSGDVGPLQVIGALSFLFFSGYFFGCYFRRRGEKRKAGQGSISPTIHPHHA